MGLDVVHAPPSYKPMGDHVVVAQFENTISLQVSRRVHAFAQSIKSNQLKGIEHLIPGFNNLTICYDPVMIGYHELIDQLESLEGEISESERNEGKTIHIPVVFGGSYGPDLEEVSKRAGLSPEEVIDLLQSKRYFVYMIGFIAGYPYCGDIDERLAIPRRSTPRVKVNKGTIQIANQQTGIFTMTAPSGWHLVGWTPMNTFDPYMDPPSLIRAGDYVQYVRIDAKEAQQWDEERQREWDEKWHSFKY